jgi:pimeloyl-ACP methyl ester carboxylesterase
VPILAICGKRDPLATRPHRSRFLKACTVPVDTKLLDTGHHCPIEAPEEVAKALIEFAKTVK